VTLLQIVALGAVAVGGTATALVRDPVRQALVSGGFGLQLAFLFFAFEAPDVALSEIVVTSVGLPIIILAALRKIRQQEERRRSESSSSEDAAE
jgi:uncharacterized MnhB-related membrane protein